MEYLQLTSIFSLLQALATGVALGIYYDIFRLFRRMFKFSAFSVAIQDMMFWITSAVVVFFVCVKLNGGFVRIYFVVFALLGWFVYFKTTGKIIFTIFDFFINIINRIFEIFRHFLIKISEKIFSKFC